MSLDEIFALHPRLRDAVQPPKLPFVTGSWSFNGEEAWDEFIRDELPNFRFGSGNDDALCGPFRAVGNCLVPFSNEGSLCWFDPTIEPAHGDFVLVGWTERYLESDQGRGMIDGWREQYGSAPGLLATKRLMRVGNDWLLAVRNGHYRLNHFTGEPNARVLGVLRRAVSADGRLLYVPPAHQIGANAATEVYNSPVSSYTVPFTFAVAFDTSSPVTSISVPAQIGATYITVAATGIVNATATGVLAQLTDTAGITSATGSEFIGSGASFGASFSMSKVYLVPANTSKTFWFTAIRDHTGGSAAATLTQVNLKVEVIKK